MKPLLLGAILLFCLVRLQAQKVYFLYLQTEGEQAFTVREGGLSYASSASGFLILSQLRDSTYTFTVSFPQDKWPANSFTVSLGGRDQGFLLRQFGEKGWGLYNLLTSVVIMGVPEKPSGKTEVRETFSGGEAVSPFAALLALASDDPSLARPPVRQEASIVPDKAMTSVPPMVKQEEQITAKAEEKKEPVLTKQAEESKSADQASANEKRSDDRGGVSEKVEVNKQAAENKEESVLVQQEKQRIAERKPPVPEVPAEIIKEDPVALPVPVSIKEEAKVPAFTARVRKYGESSTTEGFGLVYIDEYAWQMADTIRILIPAPRPAPELLVIREKDHEPAPRFIEKMDPVVLDTLKKNTETDSRDSILVQSGGNGECLALASEADFLATRRRMAAEDDEKGMLNEAILAFTKKCYTVWQVRNLGVLFLNEPGKLRFFEVARMAVIDAINFESLEAEFREPVWQQRFRELLRK